MKVGILYICTGKYIRFFRDFFQSSEEFFLPSCEKNYFVFTDGYDDLFTHDRVMRVQQNQLGWPYDTLKRFHMFCNIEELLAVMDYLFFFNANMLILKRVGEEILPCKGNDWFVGVNHPGYCSVGNDKFPYERNKKSSAYIATGHGKWYFQGCLFGGRTKEFMEMAKQLALNIDQDEKKNIMAKWHDESHLNNYFLNKKTKLLDPGYAYPESLSLPFEKVIVQIDKNKCGGHDYLRGVKNKNMSTWKKVREFFKNIF